MAKVGDVIPRMMGFTDIITDVDEDGNATGGWLIPPGQEQAFIRKLAQEAMARIIDKEVRT